MTITPYDHNEHNNILINLYKENNMPVIGSEFLPEIGYVIEDYAVCFLYRTDSAICVFENLIISPRIRRADRTKAFNLMTSTLLKRAKDEGFKVVWGVSNGVSVPSRLKHFNFENHNVNYFFRSI